MKYDEKEDHVLSEASFEVENKAGVKFEAKIRQYKAGVKKLQISRVSASDYGFVYTKLGRFDTLDIECLKKVLEWGRKELEKLESSKDTEN